MAQPRLRCQHPGCTETHLHGATAWYAIFQFLPDGIRRGSLKVELFLDVRLGIGGKITFGYLGFSCIAEPQLWFS